MKKEIECSYVKEQIIEETETAVRIKIEFLLCPEDKYEMESIWIPKQQLIDDYYLPHVFLDVLIAGKAEEIVSNNKDVHEAMCVSAFANEIYKK